jgi:MFS family permease
VGYDALQAGLATLPVTLVMFALSRRAGRLADRLGPRLFMGAGPLVAAAGLLLTLRLDADLDYTTELLPALLVFALGLSMTVAPLTATVLADADEHNAGIASAVNNAVARVAGLAGIAVLGAVVAAQFASGIEDRLSGVALSPQGRAAVAEARERNLAVVDASGLGAAEARRLVRASEAASVDAFHAGMGLSAALVALGGLVGGLGIVNRRRPVASEDCAGGQLAGAPVDAARGAPTVAEPAGART